MLGLNLRRYGLEAGRSAVVPASFRHLCRWCGEYGSCREFVSHNISDCVGVVSSELTVIHGAFV